MGNFLAPTPRWQGRDNTGQPVQFGKLYTWANGTRTNQATYSDPAGVNVNPNPVILDGKGEANIYWSDANLYSVALYTAGGQLVETQDNYPITDGSGSGPVTVSTVPNNFVRNPQFYFWTNGGEFINPTNADTLSGSTYLADDWGYQVSNNSANISISQQLFSPGQVEVTDNPVAYLQYSCDVAGSAQTENFLFQNYASVTTLQNTEVYFRFWARSSTLSDIEINLVQYFGSGGSPSAGVVTGLIAETLTADWTAYQANVTLPTIAAKTLGANGDDALLLTVGFPLNSVGEIHIANMQLQASNSPQAFPYLTLDEQEKKLNSLVGYATFRTGDVKFTLQPNPEPGWIICNDGTIGNGLSNANYAGDYTKALFVLIWNTVPDNLAPIYLSNGTQTVRGATAEDDYDDDKQLALTKQLGRVISCKDGTFPIGDFGGNTVQDFTISQANLPILTLSGSFEVVGEFGQEILLFAGVPVGGTEYGKTDGGEPINVSANGAVVNVNLPLGGSATPIPVSPYQPTSFLNCMIKL